MITMMIMMITIIMLMIIKIQNKFTSLKVCPPWNLLDNGPFPFWFPHRGSSGNTMKDSSEEGQPQPAPKPKDKVNVST